MLKQLLTLLRKGDTIGLSIGCEASGGPSGTDRFRINVLPKLFTLDGDTGPDRKALNTPLTITGTADELDSPVFVEAITRFTTSATDLRHTLDNAVAAHKTAAVARSAGGSPASSPKPVAKPAPKIVAPVNRKTLSSGAKRQIAKASAARWAAVKAAQATRTKPAPAASKPPSKPAPGAATTVPKRSHHKKKPVVSSPPAVATPAPANAPETREQYVVGPGGVPDEAVRRWSKEGAMSDTPVETVTGTPPPVEATEGKQSLVEAPADGIVKHGTEVPADGTMREATIGEPSDTAAPSEAPAETPAPAEESQAEVRPAAEEETHDGQSGTDRPATAVEATPSLI